MRGRSVRGCSTWLFFFFQAEDGIRDLTVTGVQTCALPIWSLRRRSSRKNPAICQSGGEATLSSAPGTAANVCTTHTSASSRGRTTAAPTNSPPAPLNRVARQDRKSTRLNSSHSQISYAVFCLKKKKKHHIRL